jgi:hypothetical protein
MSFFDFLVFCLSDPIIRLIFASVLLFIIFAVTFLLYTYNRSFLVHQDTLKLGMAHNADPNSRFLYRIHVGHDGTTLDPIPLPREAPLPL